MTPEKSDRDKEREINHKVTPGSIPWARRRVRGERREGLGNSREKKKDRCGLKLGKRKRQEREKIGENAGCKKLSEEIGTVYCNNQGRCIKVFYLLQQGFGCNMSNSCIDFQSCCNKFFNDLLQQHFTTYCNNNI